MGLAADEFGVHAGVDAVLGEEAVVGAAFDDAAVVEDEEEVGVADGAEAVCDDEARAALEKGSQGLLDEAFGLRVHGAGRFVEDEDARCGDHGAGDGDELPFSGAEVSTAFADFGGVAGGETFDDGVRSQGFGGVMDLGVGGLRASELEVVHHGAGEEEVFLGDHAQLAVEGGEGVGGNGKTVDAYLACLGFVETGQEADDAGLAGAGVADEGHGRSRGN